MAQDTVQPGRWSFWGSHRSNTDVAKVWFSWCLLKRRRACNWHRVGVGKTRLKKMVPALGMIAHQQLRQRVLAQGGLLSNSGVERVGGAPRGGSTPFWLDNSMDQTGDFPGTR